MEIFEVRFSNGKRSVSQVLVPITSLCHHKNLNLDNENKDSKNEVQSYIDDSDTLSIF